MATFIGAKEYVEDGIAIIEDTQGKYVVTKQSSTIIPLPDFDFTQQRKPSCVLVQSVRAMMT